MNYLIAITANLAGMLVIYSLLAFALVRLRWHGRGGLVVLVAIIVAGQFWQVPAWLVIHSSSAEPASYSLWFCNWLVSAFAVVVFCQTVKGIPRQLEDSALLDGCGWFGIYWHVLLPLVKRDLGLIAFLTVTAVSVHFLSPINVGETPAEFLRLPVEGSDTLIAVAFSLLMTLPVIAIFLLARPYLWDGQQPGGTGSVPSKRQDAR